MDRSSSQQLPTEILPNMSWRKLSVLVILSIFIMLLTNLAAIGYLNRYSINYGYWTIHQKWNLLGQLNSPVDWLILGDSSCSQGVIPSTFNIELNQSAINLCTTGDMGTLGDLWMLEEYIQRFDAPQNVLVVHTYDIWYRDFNPVRLGQIPRPWNFWENHTFGNELLTDSKVRDATFLEHYVPLFSQKKSIGMIIRNTLAGNHNPFIALWTIGSDGFVPALEPKPEVVVAGEQQQLDFVSQNNFHVSTLNDQALQATIDVAEKHNINLYLANAPVFADLFAHPAYQAYYQPMQVYLQEIADQSSNINYISSVKTFPAEQMQNPDHLIMSGAEDYTRWLVEEILLTGE